MNFPFSSAWGPDAVRVVKSILQSCSLVIQNLEIVMSHRSSTSWSLAIKLLCKSKLLLPSPVLGTDMQERNHHSDDSGANYDMLLSVGLLTKYFQPLSLYICMMSHQCFLYSKRTSYEVIATLSCILKHKRLCPCFNSRHFSLLWSNHFIISLS